MKREKATFAAGCFWGVEGAFANLSGVLATQVGYTGGAMENPSYEDVCTGTTGHAESVQVEYDADQISYQALLGHFFSVHDPTTLNRQGPDVGSQYRSAIFYHEEGQRRCAEEIMHRLQASLSKRMVTQLVPAGPFYPAEEYHQGYLAKRGLSFCHI